MTSSKPNHLQCHTSKYPPYWSYSITIWILGNTNISSITYLTITYKFNIENSIQNTPLLSICCDRTGLRVGGRIWWGDLVTALWQLIVQWSSYCTVWQPCIIVSARMVGAVEVGQSMSGVTGGRRGILVRVCYCSCLCVDSITNSGQALMDFENTVPVHTK